jgi:hypothetical protein
MKDNRVRIFAALLLAAGCAKSDKAADVAQDSILVKDADIGGNKTDTAGAATAALVRASGSAANAPVLTTGAPVKGAPDVGGATSNGVLRPPKRVNPTPVLPGRESTVTPRSTPITGMQLNPPPVPPPTPVTQPVSPPPPPVTQPSATPKKDSTKGDTLSLSR